MRLSRTIPSVFRGGQHTVSTSLSPAAAELLRLVAPPAACSVLVRPVDCSSMCICGIDEAGRGPLAGPVTAAAVVLTDDFDITVLRDSKRLTPAHREALADRIFTGSSFWGVGWSWPEEIDRHNIHNATLTAMARAYAELIDRMHRRAVYMSAIHVQVDGKFVPALPAPCEAVVGGDGSVPAIMAASIVAKVLRDRWMSRYHEYDPRFGFDKHKGYPSLAHRKALMSLGASSIHRRTFRGVPADSAGSA